MTLSVSELRILSTRATAEVADPPPQRTCKPPTPRLISYKPLPGRPETRLAVGASAALFAGKLDPVRLAHARVERGLGDIIAELRSLKTAPPPEGAAVLEVGPNNALSGLPGKLFLGYDADKGKAVKHFDPLLIARLPILPSKLRRHEDAFANKFAKDVRGTLAAYLALVGETGVFEVDLAKRLYAPWGKEKNPLTDEERRFRAESNLALHQTAVAIARLAFLQRLDELAALPADDPRRRVLVTMGGSGAGKGRLTKILKVAMPNLKVGATFDVAGEGEARECAFLLAECKKRGLHADFVYFHKPVQAAVVRAVERTKTGGRMVDLLPLVRGHIVGSDVVRDFSQSSAFLVQQRAGKARIYGLSSGDEVLDPDPMALRFPFAERLDKEWRLHVPKSDLTESQAVLAALVELTGARERKQISEAALRGALMGIAVVWPDYFDSLNLKLFPRDKKTAA